MADGKNGFLKGLLQRVTGTVSPAEAADQEKTTETDQQAEGFFSRLKNGLKKPLTVWLDALMRWFWGKRDRRRYA